MVTGNALTRLKIGFDAVEMSNVFFLKSKIISFPLENDAVEGRSGPMP
jgi:hypothetical protein